VVSLFTTSFAPLPYSAAELPLFVLLAAGCGYLGGLFVLCHQRIAELRRSGPRWARNSYSFALLVALLSGDNLDLAIACLNRQIASSRSRILRALIEDRIDLPIE